MFNNLEFGQFRSYCLSKNIPIISTQTESFLIEIIKQKRPNNILEIWSAIWYSTIFFSKLVKKIYSFEISYPSYLEAISNINLNNIFNINLYPFNFLKVDLNKIIFEQIDFVFIDWQKSQYGLYLQKILPYCNWKTTIILDDIIKYHNKLQSLYEYISKNQINYKILDMEEWDWIMLIEDM